MLGTEPLWQPFSRRAAARARLRRRWRSASACTCDPDARVGTLSVGERQRVEILKALYRDARILILDEPTAVLTPQESEALFATLAQMVAEGLSIIFISHKLAEVLRVSHRIAVLRGGKLVAEARDAPTTTQAQLAQWMVGRAVRKPGRARSAARATRSARSRSCTRRRRRAARLLDDVSLALRAGEIVGIAGVSGNGQEALADVLSGLRAPTRGTVHAAGRAHAGRSPPAWIARGRGAHSRRPARGRRDRRPAGVGERDCRALSQSRSRAAGDPRAAAARAMRAR